MKRLSLAPIALALGLSFSAQAEPTITICEWGTITGADALVNGMAYGARDYFEYLNQTKGGIAGVKINALLLDGRYKLDEELKIYRRCVSQENAVVIGGWSTGAAKALRADTTKDQVPFMTQSYSSDLLNPEKFPCMFMAGPTYEQQIILGLNDAKKRGARRVVLMHADNEYGRAPVKVIREEKAVEKLGMELVDVIEFKYDAQDLTAQLIRVKESKPDVVYIQSSTNQTIVILRDAAKIGLKPDLFVGNFYNINPAIPEQLKESAEGFRTVQLYTNWGVDIPAMRQINEFSKKNKIEKQDIYYMKGWLEGMVIAAAIENAVKANGGKVPEDISAFRKATRDQLAALKNFDTGGISPKLNYADHRGFSQARMAIIKGGKYIGATDWLKLADDQ